MHQLEYQIEEADLPNLTELIRSCQFFGAERSGRLCPEQRLALAVLHDAINILRKWNGSGNRDKQRAFVEAGQWVATRGFSHTFSFDSLCDTLDIAPDMLRERLASFVTDFGMRTRPSSHGQPLHALSREPNATRPLPARRNAHTPCSAFS
jgi:hypothetical protein